MLACVHSFLLPIYCLARGLGWPQGSFAGNLEQSSSNHKNPQFEMVTGALEEESWVV